LLLLWLTIVGFGDFSGFGEISMKFVFFDVFANEVSAWLGQAVSTGSLAATVKKSSLDLKWRTVTKSSSIIRESQ